MKFVLDIHVQVITIGLDVLYSKVVFVYFVLIFRGQEYHLSKTSSGSSSILFVSVSPFTFGKYIYIHYCTIIAIRDVDDINGRKVCDWWLLMASTARIIMIAKRDVDDINGRKVRDWWHSSRLLSALLHLMASTSRIIMIAMRDVDEIKGRKACDWRHPSIGYYKRVKGCRMGRSDKVSLWYVALLINTRFRFLMLE